MKGDCKGLYKNRNFGRATKKDDSSLVVFFWKFRFAVKEILFPLISGFTPRYIGILSLCVLVSGRIKIKPVYRVRPTYIKRINFRRHKFSLVIIFVGTNSQYSEQIRKNSRKLIPAKYAITADSRKLIPPKKLNCRFTKISFSELPNNKKIFLKKVRIMFKFISLD